MLDELVVSDDLIETVSQAREEANKHGERFNIFSILRVHRNEAETHSRFLHELLNPQGRHGEGRTFLKLFLEDVLELQEIGESRFHVTREMATEENRRVDIVIESPEVVAGIELKIDAADQAAQLHDYYQELQRRAGGEKQVILAYLTLDGKRPSAMSLHTLEKEKVRCLSYADDVSRWLQHCIEKSEHKPILIHAIQQYRQLIHNLTGKGSTVNDLVAGELSSDVEKFKAALDVEKSLPKAKASVQEIFWQELRAALEAQLGITPSVYGGNSIKAISTGYYSKNRSNKHVGLKMRLCNLDGSNICLYINLYNAVHYGLRVEDESGNVASSRALRDLVRKETGGGNAKADNNADWLVCYYYNPSTGQNADKIINFDEFNSTAVGLLDAEVRRTLIADMVSHQAELFAKVKALCGQ